VLASFGYRFVHYFDSAFDVFTEDFDQFFSVRFCGCFLFWSEAGSVLDFETFIEWVEALKQLRLGVEYSR